MKPDVPKASSLLQATQQDIDVALSLTGAKTNRTVIRNIYEAFRMIGEARLALAGMPHADHDTQIREVIRLRIETIRPLDSLEHLKRIRHAINYKGYQPDESETADALELAKHLFPACKQAVQDEIEEHTP